MNQGAFGATAVAAPMPEPGAGRAVTGGVGVDGAGGGAPEGRTASIPVRMRGASAVWFAGKPIRVT